MAGDITPSIVAIASAKSRSGPTSSPPHVWLQKEHRRRGGRWALHHGVCLMPGRLPPPSLHLPHLIYKNIPLCSREKVIRCCAFKLGLVVLMAQTLCVNVIALEYKPLDRRLFVGISMPGSKSDLVTLCYLQSSKETQAAMENCSLVSDGFDHLAELPFVNCCIKELCLFLYLFPSCWDGRSCQQKPP